jgi:uncharacterized LabA/DUF88 family protein
MKARYAILLDGGFVTKKLLTQNRRPATADDVEGLCDRLKLLPEVSDYELLRIYYYDAPPSAESIHRPTTGNQYDLNRTVRFRNSQSLYDQLVLKPGFALRMGETRLSPAQWKLKPRSIDQLKATPRALTDDDFTLDITQKGVDMRIGMDMARLAIREMVYALVVVTSDSDFVPAFKFVRREGVKVILDVLGHPHVRRELKEHADFVVG